MSNNNENSDVKVEEEVKAEDSSSEAIEEDNSFSFEQLTGMDEKKIPYNRFKAVNDEKKALKAELENMKASMSKEVEDAVLKEQIKAKLKDPANEFDSILADEPNTEVVVLKDQIKMLQEQIKNVVSFTEGNALKQEISQLRKAFPSMNEEHVLTLKKMHKDATLEECAKFSHDQFYNHAKSVYEKMLEEKKAAIEKKVVTGPERMRNLKPEELPKSLAEARAAMLKFMKE